MPTFAIAPASLHRLRRRLQAIDPQTTAALLQEAGFATGEALAVRWREHLRLRASLDEPAQLDREWFAPLLTELSSTLGWGSLQVETLAGQAVLLSSPNWTEAESNSATNPSCHFSCGVLAAFLTTQAGASIAVLEVECRSRGDAQCRFLAASTETLAAVFDVLNAGRPWQEGLPGMAEDGQSG